MCVRFRCRRFQKFLVNPNWIPTVSVLRVEVQKSRQLLNYELRVMIRWCGDDRGQGC
jgi:hypothetical protein